MEVLKIFYASPNIQFKRADLVKHIINNPDTKIRALEHYGVSSEKELRSKLMTGLSGVIRSLRKEGLIIQVCSGNKIFTNFPKQWKK